MMMMMRFATEGDDYIEAYPPQMATYVLLSDKSCQILLPYMSCLPNIFDVMSGENVLTTAQHHDPSKATTTSTIPLFDMRSKWS